MAVKEGKGWDVVQSIIRLMVGNDVDRARKRMRYAWIAGFAWAAVGLVNALVFFSGFDAETQTLWSGGQFAFVIIESAVMAALSYGVVKRLRLAAALLFFYFWISRIPLLALGIISLEAPPDLFRFLLQVLVAYLLFQGMRGAFTCYYLTHPYYPAVLPRQEAGAGKG